MLNIDKLKKIIAKSIHWFVIPIIASLMVMWPTVQSGIERLQPDYGDVLFNLYLFEHVFKHFSSTDILNQTLFWSPNFYWPVANVYTWSDHLLGPSTLYAPWRLFFNPFESYFGWIITTLTLNYVSIRWSLGKITKYSNPIFLSAIALTATFNPAVTVQISHPQMLSLYIFGPLLILWNQALSKDTGNLSVSQLILLLSLTLFNSIFNIYLVVYGAFCTISTLLVHAITRIYQKNYSFKPGSRLKISAFFAISTVLATTYIYLPYLSALSKFGKRSDEQIIENLPKAASWLHSTTDLLLNAPYGIDFVKSNPEMIYGQEQSIFPGWFFLIAFIYSVMILFSKKIKLKSEDAYTMKLRWLIVSAFLAIATINFYGFSLWLLIMNFIPGASALRASSRVTIIVIIFCSGFLALSSKDWNLRLNLKPKIVSIFNYLMLTFSFLSIWIISSPSFSLKTWRLQSERLATKLKNNPQCDVFWLSKSLQEPWARHIQAMHISLMTGIRTVNGVSGHSPKGGWPAEDPSVVRANEWIQKISNSSIHLITDNKHKQYTLCEINDEDADSTKINSINGKLSES
jgi:hypothetical protein